MADYLVAVIGSRGLIEERVPGYIELLTENGFLILDQSTVEPTAAQAALLLGQGESEPAAFTSGPCVALLLKRDNAYATFNSLRLELDYTYGSLTGWLALRDRAAFFPQEPVLERVLLVVKPGYEQSAAGNVYAELSALLDQHDFVVLAKEMKLLGAEAAGAIAQQPEQKEESEYLTSEMSIVLALEKIGAIEELQLLLGPTSPEEARQHAPHTLRARLSDADAPAFRNLAYASESSTRATRDLALFFPAPFPIERTCAILKPDVVANHSPHRVLELLRLNGFTVQAQEEVYISKQRAELFLQAHRDLPTYDAETTYLSSGPCLVLILNKAGAIDAWLRLLGPEDPVVARETKPRSLRALLGTDLVHNGLHGSSSAAEAQRDIDEFFPAMPLERLPTSLQELQDVLTSKPGLQATHGAPHRAQANVPSKSLYEVLLEGLTQLCRVKPTGDDAVLYLADWLLEHNPNKPAVTQPVEAVPQVTLAEELEASVSPSAAVQPGPLAVTWLVGAPGTNKTALAARAVKELSAQGTQVEHVSVSALLEQVAKTSSEHGALVSEYLATARTLPPHVLTPLLVSAIRASPSRRVLVSAFPYSLDQSFDLEKAVGSAATRQLVCLDCHKADAHKLAERAAKGKGADGAAFARKLKAFAEDMQPVIEHYELFGKVRRIDAGREEEEEVFRQLKKLLAK